MSEGTEAKKNVPTRNIQTVPYDMPQLFKMPQVLKVYFSLILTVVDHDRMSHKIVSHFGTETGHE